MRSAGLLAWPLWDWPSQWCDSNVCSYAHLSAIAVLLVRAKGMQISGHAFCDFHAWPGRRVRNAMDWFVFVLVISVLLNQPEPGALQRLFLVHFLQLLVQQADMDT